MNDLQLLYIVHDTYKRIFISDKCQKKYGDYFYVISIPTSEASSLLTD